MKCGVKTDGGSCFQFGRLGRLQLRRHAPEEELMRPFSARPVQAGQRLGDARNLGMAGVLLVEALAPGDLAVNRQDRCGDLGEIVDPLRADRLPVRAETPLLP